MLLSLMTVHIRFGDEPVTALIAHERLLPCVAAHVDLKVPSVIESLLAHGANVLSHLVAFSNLYTSSCCRDAPCSRSFIAKGRARIVRVGMKFFTHCRGVGSVRS